MATVRREEKREQQQARRPLPLSPPQLSSGSAAEGEEAEEG